jgi:hypothetical protein
MTAVEAVEVVVRWFDSDEGRAAVHKTLAARGLPSTLASDLRQEVYVALLAYGGEIDNPIGFATRALRFRATDLLRARRRSLVVTLPAYEDGVAETVEPADPADGPDGPALLDAVDGALVDHVRRVLADAEPVRARSAALTAVTVADEAPQLPGDCPVPGQGAVAADAAWWAGVWFAGGADLFADGSSATRKARSRRIAEARALLAAAHASAVQP